MLESDDLSFSPELFSGKVRLFPLPNLVMFPSVMQPLRVFEPRYIEMVEDAIAGDKLLAMGVLEPGWEHEYEGRPPVAPLACLGKIATQRRIDSGEYVLLLLGLRRIRLARELPAVRSFREWEVELLDDVAPSGPPELQAGLQKKLLSAFQALLPKMPVESESLDDLLRMQISLGMLTDIVSYTLDLDLAVKRKLLGELQVVRRAELLLGELALLTTSKSSRPAGLADFPPKFSSN